MWSPGGVEHPAQDLVGYPVGRLRRIHQVRVLRAREGLDGLPDMVLTPPPRLGVDLVRVDGFPQPLLGKREHEPRARRPPRISARYTGSMGLIGATQMCG